MRKNASVKRNYIYNLIYDVLVLIVPLITTPYVSRVLAVESVGLYSYTYSIILYFTAFVALGTKSYAIKQVSRAENRQEISKVFWNTFSLRLLVGLFALAVYYGMVCIIGKNIEISLLQSIYIIAVIFDISWFFQGKENFKIIIFRNLLIKVFSVILIFAFVKDNNDLLIYVLALSVPTLLGNLSLWGYLRQYLVKINLFNIRPFTGIKEILVLFIPTLALQMYAAIDKTMLGVLTGSTLENGYYFQADKIVKLVLTIVTTISVVTLPRISSLFSKKEYDKVNSNMQTSYRFAMFISLPMMLGLCAISDILIPWFLGDKYQKCVILLYILSLLFPIMGTSNITGFQYLVATDRQNYYSFSIAAGTAMNILLNIILIPSLKSVGAALATVVAELFIMIIQLFYIVVSKKEFTFNQIFGKSWRYIISAVTMFFMIILLKKVSPTGFVGVLFAVILGIATYIVLLIFLKDDMVIDFIRLQIINKLFRKKRG